MKFDNKLSNTWRSLLLYFPLLCLVVILLSLTLYLKKDKTVVGNKTSNNTNSCQTKVKVPISNDKSAYLWVCEDQLVIDYPPLNWTLTSSKGDQVLDDSKSFFDLFFVEHMNGQRERIPQIIDTYQTNLGTIVLVRADYVYGSANHKGTAVYLVKSDQALKIFQHDKSNPGNAAWVSIYKTNPLVIKEEFTLAPLGANSARPVWINLYSWNSELSKVVLVNDQYPKVFRDLLVSYEEYDRTVCNETGELLSIAYQKRKDQEKVCGEKDQPPYVSSNYAKEFLQAKKTVELIIDGSNLSDKDIENMNLDK